MKEIKLTQNKAALIDDEDFDLLNKFTWHAWYNKNSDSFYAHHSVYIKGKNPTVLRMHRYLLGIHDPQIHVDHENGNTLDNRRFNIRVCNRPQNSTNLVSLKSNNTSGFRGVSRYENSTSKVWAAKISVNRKQIYIGYFETPEEAAKAFDEAAKKYYGEFCGKLNFE